MDQDIGEFVDDNEVRRILGIPSENVESHWGHQKLNEIYEDDIENIDIDQLINMELQEDDFTPQTAQISNIGLSFDTARPNLMATNAMMSRRDPMISQGTMALIRNDGALAVKKQKPVLLQQRIQSDSTNKAGVQSDSSNISGMFEEAKNSQLNCN